MQHVMRRAIALQNARDKAKNPEFKDLWHRKLKELIELAEAGGQGYGYSQKGFKGMMDLRVH
jgi:hypothetical protein|tara:strand:+ start:203 stop:388 length:186 start_codon:yes stop_codon:yes gene_type:complete